MLNISDLKIGSKIIFNNAPCEIIYTEHSKLGRGGSILRTKIKNLIDGSQFEKTFAGAEKVDAADLQMKQAQYLYSDDEKCYFMDGITFEQFDIMKKQISTKVKFLKEGENVDILYFDDAPINVSLAIKIKFKISYTEPGFKGNTSSTALKPATIETGAQVNVPLFIKENDEIIVDTRTGQYVERA